MKSFTLTIGMMEYWKGGHQSFTFSGRHFGNLAFVEDDSSDELDIIVPLTQRPSGCLPNDSESFREDLSQ